MFKHFIIFLSTLIYLAYPEIIKFVEEFTTDDFVLTQSSLAGWSFDSSSYKPSASVLHYDCGIQINHRLFGGYGIFPGSRQSGSPKPKKTFLNLPPHYQIQLKVKLFKIDSWNQESLYYYVDGKQYFVAKLDCCFNGTDFCGSKIPPTSTFLKQYNPSYQDGIIKVDQKITHSATSVTILFWSNIDNEENESWGFRELYIYVYKCNATCFQCVFGYDSADKCTACFAGSVPWPVSNASGSYCQCSGATFMDLTTECTMQTCSKCVVNCPSNYYGNSTDKLCYHCSTQCRECSDFSICTSCYQGFFLNTTDQSCQLCQGPCLNCSSNATTCTSCINEFFLDGANSQCLSCVPDCQDCINGSICIKCNPTFYLNASNGQCYLCPGHCDECNTLNSNICYHCSEGYYLNKSLCFSVCPTPMWGDLVQRICITNCTTGYYPSEYGRICRFCDDITVRCFGGRAADSLECIEGYFLYLKTCLESCPAGSFADSSTKTCNQQTTTNIMGQSYACQVSCQFGYYYDYSAWGCLPCASNCAACDILDKNKCLTCFPPYYLANYTCILALKCTTAGGILDTSNQLCLNSLTQQQPCTYYDNSTKILKACHPTCCNQTCTNADPCCPVGSYYDVLQQDCLSCHPSCFNCSNTSTNCLSCIQPVSSYNRSDTILTNNSCPCLPGTIDINTLLCAPCHYSCLECAGLGPDSCTSCVDASTSNRIDLSAPDGGSCPCFLNFTDDPSSFLQSCTPCHYSCLSCVVSGGNGCSSCLTTNNRIDNSNNQTGGSCICLPGFYDAGSNAICQPCYYTCSSCVAGGAQNCTLCNNSDNRIFSNISIYIVPYTGQRIDQGSCDCQTGFFDNLLNQSVCSPCYYACGTCISYGQFLCTSCPSAATTLRIDMGNYCPCPTIGFYDDGSNQTCLACHYSCKTCSGNEHDATQPTVSELCLTCQAGSNRMFAVNITNIPNGSCLCNAGFYDFGFGQQTCLACNPACATCVGGAGFTCLTCSTILSDHRVNIPINNCPCESGYFDEGFSQCRSCSPSCSGGNCTLIATNCSSCPNLSVNHRIDNSSLGNTCPCQIGWFECNGLQTCCQCNPQCLTCSGGNTSNNCTSCNNSLNLALDPISKSCQCALNSFFDPVNLTCNSCHISCRTCSGSNNNTSCMSCQSSSTSFRISNITMGTIGNCPCMLHYYDDNSSSACQQCNSHCLDCLSSSENDCISCNASQFRVLDNNSSGGNTFKCICMQGYYNDSSSPICQPCNYTCAECTQQSMATNYQCTRCDNVTQLRVYNIYTTAGPCPCLVGYFDIPGDKNCQPCNPPCKTCQGNADTCVTCDDGFWSDQGMCQPCSYACGTCQINDTTCTSCIPDTFRNASRNCKCDYHYFEVVAMQQPICTQCSHTCQECIDETDYNCTSCPKNSYRISQPNSLSACPCLNGYRDIQEPVCSNCHITCQTCSTNSLNDPKKCLSCYQGSNRELIVDSSAKSVFGSCKCIYGFSEDISPDGMTCMQTDCPPGKFRHSQEEECRNCFYTCDRCLDTRYDHCTKCFEERGLQLQAIVGTCTCSKEQDEDGQGLCINSYSNVSKRQTVIVFTALSLAIGFLIAGVNGKILILLRFIDVAQQLGLIFLINIHFPNNYDDIFAFLSEFNFHRLPIIPNMFKIGSEGAGILTYTELQKYSLENQNSLTKFRLADYTCSFLVNSGGVIELVLLAWGFVYLCRFLSRKLKGRKQQMAARIRRAIDISLPLFIIYTTSSEVTIHFLLQSTKPSFDNSFNGFSYLASFIYYIWSSFFIYRTVQQLRSLNVENLDKFPSLRERNSIILINIKQDSSRKAKYWFFFQMTKKISLGAFVYTFYSIPILQILTLNLIQVIYTVFQIRYNPYDKRYLRLLTNGSEILQSLAYFGVLIHVEQQEIDRPAFSAIYFTIIMVILITILYSLFLLGNIAFELTLFIANLRILLGISKTQIVPVSNYHNYPHTFIEQNESSFFQNVKGGNEVEKKNQGENQQDLTKQQKIYINK